MQYSEQALLRVRSWGVGLHFILNRCRVGVAIILNGPFLSSFYGPGGVFTPHKPIYLASLWASFVALVLV